MNLLRALINTIKVNKTFFIAYNLLLLMGLYPLLAWDKIEIFLFINRHHHPWLDSFFPYFTQLGNGITYVILIFLLFLLKVPYRKLLVGITSFGVMSIIVQFLKRVVFSHHLRPIKHIELANQAVQLHVVDNVDVLTHLSFPSGHTATIFTAACFLSLLAAYKPSKVLQVVPDEDVTELVRDTDHVPTGYVTSEAVIALFKIRKSTLYTLLLLTLAVVVAFSRIYLSQHFYLDVYIGALIGGWTTFLVHAFLIDLPMPSWLTSRLPFKL